MLHVLVPHGRNRDDLEHPEVRVKVHESRQLGEGDVHPVLTPPRTRFARSIVDAASFSATDGRCRAVIAAAVQQRRARAADLRAVALRRPTLARRGLILETIADVEGGSHSLPELAWLRGLRRAGLPTPTRQQIVRCGDGHYVLDADFEPFGVAVEINGAQHVELLQSEADDLRRARVSIGGRLLVDLSSYMVRHRNDVAVMITASALLSRGWQPSARARRRLAEMAASQGQWTWTAAAPETIPRRPA